MSPDKPVGALEGHDSQLAQRPVVWVHGDPVLLLHHHPGSAFVAATFGILPR